MFSTDNHICYSHFFSPKQDCMTCIIMAATDPNVPEMYGTTYLATSIYPKMDPSILAGPEFPSNPPQIKSFTAPVAQMFSPPHLPALKLDTNMTFISNFWYPALEPAAVHDHYSEQLALDPEDHAETFAGIHYSDKHALSPIEEEIGYYYVEQRALSYEERRKLPRRGRKQSEANTIKETGHGYAEELALSPACKERRKLPPRRRKQSKGNMADTADSIIVDVPGEEQQRGSGSRGQVEDEKHEDAPMEKPARGRKRKHLVDQEELPVRRSKRSRNAISYKE